MKTKAVTLVENRQKKIPLTVPLIEQWLLQLLELLGCEEMEVSLTLVGDEEIRSINRDYLGKDRPTNVISFSMREGEFSDVAPHLLGDIILSVDTAKRQADEGDIPLEDMVLFLMIHGLLHLLGYDHEGSDEDRRAMTAREDELFLALRHYRLERDM